MEKIVKAFLLVGFIFLILSIGFYVTSFSQPFVGIGTVPFFEFLFVISIVFFVFAIFISIHISIFKSQPIQEKGIQDSYKKLYVRVMLRRQKLLPYMFLALFLGLGIILLFALMS